MKTHRSWSQTPRRLITKVGLIQLQLFKAQNPGGLDLTCSKSIYLNLLSQTFALSLQGCDLWVTSATCFLLMPQFPHLPSHNE